MRCLQRRHRAVTKPTTTTLPPPPPPPADLVLDAEADDELSDAGTDSSDEFSWYFGRKPLSCPIDGQVDGSYTKYYSDTWVGHSHVKEGLVDPNFCRFHLKIYTTG